MLLRVWNTIKSIAKSVSATTAEGSENSQSMRFALQVEGEEDTLIAPTVSPPKCSRNRQSNDLRRKVPRNQQTWSSERPALSGILCTVTRSLQAPTFSYRSHDHITRSARQPHRELQVMTKTIPLLQRSSTCQGKCLRRPL